MVTVDGRSYEFGALIEGAEVRAEPGGPTVLVVQETGALVATSPFAAEASTSGRLTAERPRDADWTRPQAMAAVVAVAQALASAGPPRSTP